MTQVMSALEAEEIDRLRKEVDLRIASNNIDGARATAMKTAEALRQSAQKAGQFVAYWVATESLEYHRHLWQLTLLPVSSAEKSESTASVAATESLYVKELRDAPDLPTGMAHWIELRQLYQKERLRLTKLADDSAAAPRPRTIRELPCAVPVPGPGGTHAVSLAPASTELGKFYPPGERTFQVEGRVLLAIDVDTGGCVQSAAIAESTGSPALDEAGIAFAMQASFVAAELDSKPVASSVRLPVNFSMQDTKR